MVWFSGLIFKTGFPSSFCLAKDGLWLERMSKITLVVGIWSAFLDGDFEWRKDLLIGLGVGFCQKAMAKGIIW